ncbi:MAG: hypothetical protein FWB75_10045, partial [Oscillospiraceae bacterium]|nr:hypothetical protein [Oscillospiraceae bacterium]
MHTRASIKKLFYALSLAVVTVVISGCFALPVEPPVLPPPTITVPEPREFETVQVSVGDIRLEDSPFALYLPSRIE